MKEIERKFLVEGNIAEITATAQSSVHIVQGYLNTDPDRTVRVRIGGEEAFLTVKGRNEGIERFEWEIPIPVEDAGELLGLCGGVIDKTRWRIPGTDGHLWELDVFHADNEGLVVAEVELKAKDEEFARPRWLGREVSDDPRYCNSSLMKNSYKTWKII